MAQFSEDAFGRYVCDGDQATIEIDGFTVTATVHRDEDSGPPWKDSDGHGPVTEWVRRDKLPGERILASDRGSHRFYDVAEAVRIAKRDGWGGEGKTAGERAANAVERDFKYLQAWCNDEWFYVGVAVTVSRDGVQLTDDYDHACWGIDANSGEDNNYLAEVANDYINQALDAARQRARELAASFAKVR